MSGSRDKEVTGQSDPQGLGEEDSEVVTHQGLRQVGQLPALDAHVLHSRRRFEGSRDDQFPPEQGQEGDSLRRDQEAPRGEV